jgi:hypothetical protein
MAARQDTPHKKAQSNRLSFSQLKIMSVIAKMRAGARMSGVRRATKMLALVSVEIAVAAA